MNLSKKTVELNCLKIFLTSCRQQKEEKEEEEEEGVKCINK